MNPPKGGCASETTWTTWHSINWNKVRHAVKSLQARIVKAIKLKHFHKAKALLHLLTRSFYGKLLAILRVTTNKGSKTCGVDNVIWDTPQKRWKAIEQLNVKGYKAESLKRKTIPKKNGKFRHLGIPTIRDRAIQALYKLALEPIAETLADPNSYGFRPKRSCADAIKQCHNALSQRYSAQWILEADIKGCFDNISHQWILQHIPLSRKVLTQWLKAGYMDKKHWFPTESGAPQGSLCKALHNKIYANYLGVSESEIEQILSCVTLNKDNFTHHLEIPAPAPPMYFQVSENQLIRSLAGSLGNPFRFLNIELKRKFKRDYDIAVNNRESRFRRDLFLFFPHERIIKIPREINISFRGMRTDVDAVAFDTETKTLGLFQLKWQDPFAHSMKERYSRISNLFPKANEWIEKMKFWLSNSDNKTILNSLQISKSHPDIVEINEICVFIIGRNDVHFTGVELDNRVAWGSWHQVIESQARVETKFDDPIKEMFVKLKSFMPDHRADREEIPRRQDFDVTIGHYKVFYKNKNETAK